MSSVNREAAHWDQLAAADPMWVILTEPGRQGEWSEAEFFDSGRAEIADALAMLGTRCGVTPRRGSAVDFGCGLGRLTQALAEHFEHAHGIDISAAMIAKANEYNRHGAKVTYHANVSDKLAMLPGDSIDFVYSRITLQHIPSATALGYLSEFARVLAPGGVAMVQALTRARSWAVRARHRVRDLFPTGYRRLRDLVSARARWEMNTVDERRARNALASHGAEVVAVLEDASGGPAFDSRWLVAVRRR